MPTHTIVQNRPEDSEKNSHRQKSQYRQRDVARSDMNRGWETHLAEVSLACNRDIYIAPAVRTKLIEKSEVGMRGNSIALLKAVYCQSV